VDAVAVVRYPLRYNRTSTMPTVFLDVDSQLDFLFPAGALYVPGAERVLPNIARLNRHAAAHGIPVISTVDAHAENDREFKVWPHHCVAGTHGQRKAEATLVDRRVVIPNRECPLDLAGIQQIIIEKQNVDVFTAPNLAHALDLLSADRCIVYGVVTEICVLHAARGLFKSGRKVVVVTDAIETLNPADSQTALDEIVGAGGTLARTADLC
jgi:nicotinamidase/pyrazinamidase